MKKLAPEFIAHLEGEVTTLCRCWILELLNGHTMGFTDHDQDIEVAGVLCEGSSGMESSGVEERLGFSGNSSEISGALQSNRIEVSDISAGLYDGATVTSYRVNWQNPEQRCIDHVSTVGEIVSEDGLFRFEMQGPASKLDQSKGRHFVHRCQANLGDSACKFNLGKVGFSGSGTVSKIISKDMLEVSGLSEFASNWFRHGRITWESGQNSGLKMEVLDHIILGDQVKINLWQEMPYPLLEGDEFTIIAGCDKSFETCKTKFGNALNFRGFPHMPGNKYALSYVGNTSDFDGKPIVP